MDLAPMPSPRSESFPSELVAAEEGLVGLAGAPGMTVALLVGVVVGDRDAVPELPSGFARRLLVRLKGIVPHLRDPENGAIAMVWLGPMADVIERLEVEATPELAGLIGPDEDAFALEVLRRTLFLRLGDEVIAPIGQALLVLGGVLAAAWTDPRAEFFGPALSAWSRVSRLQNFWAPMMPDTETARWVLRG